MQPQDMVGNGEDMKMGREMIGAEDNLLCQMCHVEEMGASPITTLACRHTFHSKCIAKRLKKKWHPNKRITFNHLDCPICKKEMVLDY